MNDTVTPFMLNDADVRGRVVRLGPVANTILGRYDYPPAIATMMGELLLVAAMLSSNLKQEGIFTIQVRGKGLIPLLVVDAVYGGQLRGFAEIPEEARPAIEALKNPTPRELFGDDAYFAITLDPGADMQRYQGVVALEGDSMTDALAHYFTHSQQVDVLFRLAVEKGEAGWAAGGLMVERLPEASTPSSEASEADTSLKHLLTDEMRTESWRYATALASTAKPAELTDTLLDAPDLLYRLFHEEGVWVHDPLPLSAGCRCSREKIENLLLSMPITDRADMIVDGVASVHCQFCNTTELFTPEQLGLSVN